MMTNTLQENPYSPLEAQPPAPKAPSKEPRIAAALFSLLIGMPSLSLGLLISSATYAWSGSWNEQEDGPFMESVLTCAAWLVIGIGWNAAAGAFLFGKPTWGIVLATVGSAAFILYFVLL